MASDFISDFEKKYGSSGSPYVSFAVYTAPVCPSDHGQLCCRSESLHDLMALFDTAPAGSLIIKGVRPDGSEIVLI